MMIVLRIFEPYLLVDDDDDDDSDASRAIGSGEV